MKLYNRMILNRDNLFNDKKDNKLKIYVGNNESNLLEIKDILEKYKVFSKKGKKKLLGLDFEFNSAKIALAQLNLDDFILNDMEVILVFDPRDKLIKEVFRQVVLLENVWIILHGAESLDLPYLINDLLNKKSKDVVNFFRNMIDTKFLCEYTLFDKPGRCKINYLLEQQGVITKKFLDKMLQNEEKMGKIYLVHVNVKKLSTELLLYSSYDVIFLPDLIRKLEKNTPFIEIVRFTQINYMMKYNLLREFLKAKNIISKLNMSYFPQIDNENNKLTNIIAPLIEIAQSKELSRFKKIQGLKKIIDLIEKSYLYPIFIDKDNIRNITKEKIKPLELPTEIQKIFIDLAENIKNMIN